VSFRQEDSCDKDDYGAWMDWYGKAVVLGENPVPESLRSSQISHVLGRDRTRTSVVELKIIFIDINTYIIYI
jgi:hypothetical protein